MTYTTAVCSALSAEQRTGTTRLGCRLWVSLQRQPQGVTHDPGHHRRAADRRVEALQAPLAVPRYFHLRIRIDNQRAVGSQSQDLWQVITPEQPTARCRSAPRPLAHSVDEDARPGGVQQRTRAGQLASFQLIRPRI